MKTITISYFKSHISEELRRVRKGARIVISDRETPIAEVVPFRSTEPTVSIRAPRRPSFKVLNSAVRIGHDPLEYLMEDRTSR